MARWPYISNKVKPSQPIYLGDGVNTFGTPFVVNQSEGMDTKNTSSRKYPALSVKPGILSAFASITTPNALGTRNNQYPHAQDGTVWKRWDGSVWQNVQTGLTSASGKIIEFARGTDLNTILVNGTNKYAWDGSTVTNLTNAPASKLYSVHKGRLYALVGKELKFSALNLINDWTTVLDAGSITITNAKGDGSGIIEFADHIVVFTEQSMHELYGTGPLNYALTDVSLDDGCISDRSIIENNGVLYWIDYGWVNAYTGSRPVKISHKVKKYLEGLNTAQRVKCCAGKNGKYIYFAIPYGESATENTIVLEYDTDIKNWYVHFTAISQFINIGQKLYGVSPTGTIYDMESGTTENGTAIDWYHITGPWNKQSLKTKTVGLIPIIIDLPIGSTLTLSISDSVDDNDFELIYTFTASGTEQYVEVYTEKIQNVNWYRFKFSGTGPCTVHYIGDDLRLEG